MVRGGSQEVTATETEGQREKTLEDVTLLALKMEDGSMGKKKKKHRCSLKAMKNKQARFFSRAH